MLNEAGKSMVIENERLGFRKAKLKHRRRDKRFHAKTQRSQDRKADPSWRSWRLLASLRET